MTIVGVVIPSYRVKNHIGRVLAHVGAEVSKIYVVDDACPEQSGQYVERTFKDPRITVIYNDRNLGVGGATIAGIRRAVQERCDVIVKIDGDGQMDPSLVPNFVAVIQSGEADYAKGNRFFEPEGVRRMPIVRLVGNAGLSFLTKLSSGYWGSFDPTNGYFAIHRKVAGIIPLEKLDSRYFFETDMLFRLGVVSARVVDIPMHAHYGDEKSSMNPLREVKRFFVGNARNFTKRVFYNYFLRNFSIASLELVLGLMLILFGFIFGVLNWNSEVAATAGTVMAAALPIILGSQLLLAFLSYDINAAPRTALHPKLGDDDNGLALRQWRDVL